MIKWNEKTIEWFTDASDYTGYNRELAALLLERCRARDTLCDLGCGMGLVDFQLAPHFRRICCVDIDSAAIGFVNRHAGETGVRNVSGVVCNARELEGAWDTVITLFHGRPEDYTERYMRLARDRLIAVVHASPHGKLGPEAYRAEKGTDMERCAELLKRRGIPFEMYAGSLEYGQPLKSRAEAAAFARNYTLDPPEEAVEEYLQENLTETGREDFPFYLPGQRDFAIFTMDGRAG